MSPSILEVDSNSLGNEELISGSTNTLYNNQNFMPMGQ